MVSHISMKNIFIYFINLRVSHVIKLVLLSAFFTTSQYSWSYISIQH